MLADKKKKRRWWQIGKPKDDQTAHEQALAADLEKPDKDNPNTAKVRDILPRSRLRVSQNYTVCFALIAVAALGALGATVQSNAVLAEKQTRHTTTIVTMEPEGSAVVTMQNSHSITTQENAVQVYLPEYVRIWREILVDKEAQSSRWRSNKKDECASPLFWFSADDVYRRLIGDLEGEYLALKETQGEQASRYVVIGNNTPQSLGDDWYVLDFQEVIRFPNGKTSEPLPRRAQVQVKFEALTGPKCAMETNPVAMIITNARVNNV